jgi:hypothetical protein
MLWSSFPAFALSRILKRFLKFFLFVLASVTCPPIGFLIAASMTSGKRKSIYFARAWVRNTREAHDARFLTKLYWWFRKRIWPSLRASWQTIWHYYRRSQTISLIIVCSIAILIGLSLLISHVNVETTDDYLSYGLWQVAITGFLALSISALAWVLFSIEFAFRSWFVTVAFSAIVSVCVVSARLLAVDFFSTVFPFPASYAPIAFGIATTLLAVSLTSIVFAILALLFEIYFLVLLSSNFKKNVVVNLLLTAASVLGLFGAWFTTYALFEAIDPKGQLLIVRLAEKYDFTTNHMCATKAGETVLFIDNVADRAIAARFPEVKKVAPRKLTKTAVAEYMPTDFHTVRCNPLDAAPSSAGWCDKPARYAYCQSH